MMQDISFLCMGLWDGRVIKIDFHAVKNFHSSNKNEDLSL